MSTCIFQCQYDDIICLTSCRQHFESDMEKCPCGKQCPNGCPCPEYQCSTKETTITQYRPAREVTQTVKTTTAFPSVTCPKITCPDCPLCPTCLTTTTTASTTTTTASTTTTTTTVTTTTTTAATTTTTTTSEPKNKSVLIVNTHGGLKPPVITDLNGRYDKAFKFEMGRDTSASLGCSLTWKNRFYIFGGEGSHDKQISRLDRCRLSRVGTLDFPFHYASCANMADKKLFLCFDIRTIKTCRYTTNPLSKFSQAADSFHNHKHIKIAASASKQSITIQLVKRLYSGEMLAVGSWQEHKRTEIFIEPFNSWFQVDDYPFEAMGSQVNH